MSRPVQLVLLCAVATCHAAAMCDMAKGGPWTIRTGHVLGMYDAKDAPDGKSFNMSFNIRHSYGVQPGQYLPNNKIQIDMKPKGDFTCEGEFNSDCTIINWTSTMNTNTTAPGRGTCLASTWCKAYSKDCDSPKPPYGVGFGFSTVFGDNMVLQQSPSKSALYGVAGPNHSPSSVKLRVTNNDDGKTYSVDATVGTDAAHQPFGPGFEGMQLIGLSYWGAAPYVMWKALLPPMPAGGNYTITADCIGCSDDGQYQNASITNVTFGDVWHCSGQSNMWLPLESSFERNNTASSILEGKYHNIYTMAGNSGDGVTNQWRRADQALLTGWMHKSAIDPTARNFEASELFQFGAACWYFAQELTDLMAKNGDPIIPIGLTDTSIGGQRIEEYMNNHTIGVCSERSGENVPEWDGQLFGKMTLPFVDSTIKGWIWYQGENNMGATKGNSIANIGYGCEQRELIKGWRQIWSETPGTTDPLAPFGVVTLASSGTEGGPDIGAMRWSQTANYGVLPNEALPNTFVTQAYDLDDKWGPAAGHCFEHDSPRNAPPNSYPGWECCNGQIKGNRAVNMTKCMAGTNGHPEICANACAAAVDTPSHGGIHPRWKKPVGVRMGTAAYNTVYGGKAAFTGPTLSGCSLNSGSLLVEFNATLLRGDKVVVNPYNKALNFGAGTINGSLFEVMTNVSRFCVEPRPVNASVRGGNYYCPTWAGGTGNKSIGDNLDQGWIRLNITSSSETSITADLSPLNGVAPIAMRYAWGVVSCCDLGDKDLWTKNACDTPCPIFSAGSADLPANPFIARIVDKKCKCITPQKCDG